MELPRGSFHSMHKEIRLHNLLQELKRIRFTGHIAISSTNAESAIVVKDGLCILAKAGNRTGTKAWDEITTRDDEQVSAVLSELTDTQVGLALEFNPKASVDLESVKKPIQDQIPGDIPVKKHSSRSRDVPEDPVPPPPRDGIYFQRKTRLSDLKNQTSAPEVVSDTVDRDLERLDQMDLDALARNVKKHSTELIKGLNLGYLLEQGKT